MELKFKQIRTKDREAKAIFEIIKCANTETIEYDNESFKELLKVSPIDPQMYLIAKYLDDYETYKRRCEGEGV
jgi:hypothetical protein